LWPPFRQPGNLSSPPGCSFLQAHPNFFCFFCVNLSPFSKPGGKLSLFLTTGLWFPLFSFDENPPLIPLYLLFQGDFTVSFPPPVNCFRFLLFPLPLGMMMVSVPSAPPFSFDLQSCGFFSHVSPVFFVFSSPFF